MKITGMDHVGIAVKSIAEGARFYENFLKLNISREFEVLSQNIRIAAIPLKDITLELVEPTAKESPIAKFLEKRGEGIHHLCFTVEDIESALEELRSQGIELIDQKARFNPLGDKIAFLDPKSTGGVLIELKEKSKA
jgi:methylmalonyl-CoA epimerase